MDALILRFDAPLMSFGGVMVDQHGPINRFPGLAMLTGLLANALGYRHSEFDRLQSLQEQIRFAARWDLEPEHIIDYHTVDLGQEKMRHSGWTTRGMTEHRAGGSSAKFGTHQRYRHYWANGVMTLALTLEEGSTTLDEIEAALHHPARPLFLGRKTCLPAAPLLLERTQSINVLDALCCCPVDNRAAMNGEETLAACWPANIHGGDHSQIVSRYDQREWRNQIHAGRRSHYEGRIGRPTS
jgi:CRISPR system Cascade subunit CasD